MSTQKMKHLNKLENVESMPKKIQALPKTDLYLLGFFILNLVFFVFHIAHNCENVYYFFQLTIIGHVLVLSNFLLSILLHQKKSSHKTKMFLSRLHLMTLGLQAVVVIGFWGLKIFFRKGIIKEGQEYTWITQILSFWVHGGSFATMFYFIKIDQILTEKNKQIKYFIHSIWGLSFIFLQFLRWYLTGQHVYGFLVYFTWVQIFVFQAILYFIAVGIDYILTIRHGLQLTIKHIKTAGSGGSKKGSAKGSQGQASSSQDDKINKYEDIQQLQKEKQIEDKKQYEKEEREGRNRLKQTKSE